MMFSRYQLVLRSWVRSVSTNCKLFEIEYLNSRIPITETQRLLLATGSSFGSLFDPTRADMIAIMGETTGNSAMKYMLERMENDADGSRILRDMPRINSKTVDLAKLKTLPEGTLGHAYMRFLKVNNVTPDSRDMVRFVSDLQLAYVMQRYREIHDLVHTILNMSTNMLGEVTVKWVEAFQNRLPLGFYGGLLGAVRLGPVHRKRYVKYYLPWAIETGFNSKFLMNVYYEERWEQSMDSLLKELNIKPLDVPNVKTNIYYSL